MTISWIEPALTSPTTESTSAAWTAGIWIPTNATPTTATTGGFNIVIRNNVFTGPGDRTKRVKNGWWIRRKGDIWRFQKDT